MNEILLEFMGVVIRLLNILAEQHRLQENLYEICIRMRSVIEEERDRSLMAEEREEEDRMDVIAEEGREEEEEEESSSEEESESRSEEDEGELEDYVYSFL